MSERLLRIAAEGRSIKHRPEDRGFIRMAARRPPMLQPRIRKK